MPLYYKQNSSWKEFSPNPYPIGTLYYATKDVSPASLVGGTWKKLDVSSKEELTGIVAKPVSSDNGRVTQFAFYHDGSKVTGTFTWRNGNSSYTALPILSGLPTIASASKVVGSISEPTTHGTCNIVIKQNGELELHDTYNLSWGKSYTASISYTTNQMLGGADFVYERTA